MTAVWSFDFYGRQLDDVFEKALLYTCRNLVRLIEVDDQEL